MVSTLDSQSSDPRSNLSGTCFQMAMLVLGCKTENKNCHHLVTSKMCGKQCEDMTPN